MREPAALYHFTCGHSRPGLERTGIVQPGILLAEHPDRPANHPGALPWPSALAWFTDLPQLRGDLDRWAVGMHPDYQQAATCDRTEHRFRVTDARHIVWWPRAVRQFGLQDRRHELESYPQAKPAHWWVSIVGVPAALDPIG